MYQHGIPERCGQFDEARWKAYVNELPTVDESFCIDRYEYPNVKGQYPWVFVSWNEAAEVCERDGKRLCSETEWTFACEGEDAWPYPYGFERSAAVAEPSVRIPPAPPPIATDATGIVSQAAREESAKSVGAASSYRATSQVTLGARGRPAVQGALRPLVREQSPRQ